MNIALKFVGGHSPIINGYSPASGAASYLRRNRPCFFSLKMTGGFRGFVVKENVSLIVPLRVKAVPAGEEPPEIDVGDPAENKKGKKGPGLLIGGLLIMASIASRIAMELFTSTIVKDIHETFPEFNLIKNWISGNIKNRNERNRLIFVVFVIGAVVELINKKFN